MEKIRVLVWNEYDHEKHDAEVAALYPGGIHGTIAEALRERDAELEVRTATLDDPEQGLGAAALREADVLVYWAHRKHDEVTDEAAARIADQVHCGMGFIPLHSAHVSKPFLRLMGTTGGLRWRESGEKERLFVIEPNHPITAGLPPYFELEQEEMYGERFDIPQPDEVLLMGWYPSGELFRSGCTFRRGNGRIFYFQPGHESYPTYHHPLVRRILANAVRWAAPQYRAERMEILHPEPLEPIGKESRANDGAIK